MQNNCINIIIRSHEPIMEGFEKMNINIITIFSATDYGGVTNNSAGLIYIKKNGDITPKIV